MKDDDSRRDQSYPTNLKKSSSKIHFPHDSGHPRRATATPRHPAATQSFYSVDTSPYFFGRLTTPWHLRGVCGVLVDNLIFIIKEKSPAILPVRAQEAGDSDRKVAVWRNSIGPSANPLLSSWNLQDLFDQLDKQIPCQQNFYAVNAFQRIFFETYFTAQIFRSRYKKARLSASSRHSFIRLIGCRNRTLTVSDPGLLNQRKVGRPVQSQWWGAHNASGRSLDISPSYWITRFFPSCSAALCFFLGFDLRVRGAGASFLGGELQSTDVMEGMRQTHFPD